MIAFYRFDDQGFSLVELLVAMTVFTIGLLGVAGMQLAAIRGNSSSNSLTVADNLAAGVLEEILSQRNDHPLFMADVADRLWLFGGATTVQTIAGAGTFSARYSVNADYAEPKLTRIEVKVRRVGDPTAKVAVLVGFRRRQ